MALAREYIPFLSQVPQDRYFNLDPSEFYIPDGEIAALRQDLEERLGCYIMTYRQGAKNSSPPHRHLCILLKSARLDQRQGELLEEYEKQLDSKRVIFVAYARPLEFRD